MKALVVYESKYGNTEQVARAIAAQLGEAGQVRLVDAATVSTLDPTGFDLLLVGGPTQRHGVSPTLRDRLERIPAGALRDLPAAAFDTRIRMARLLTGSAAIGIAQRLKQKGARVVTSPESFFVVDGEGPLAEGEIERARAWATDVLERAGRRAPAGAPGRPG